MDTFYSVFRSISVIYGHVRVFSIFRSHVFKTDWASVSEHVGEVFALNMIPDSYPGLEPDLANTTLITFLEMFFYKLKQFFWILKGFPFTSLSPSHAGVHGVHPSNIALVLILPIIL